MGCCCGVWMVVIGILFVMFDCGFCLKLGCRGRW